MATAPHMEAPPRTAVVPAPRPGPPAPRPRPTTASATAPRPLPTAPAAAATPGAPRLPPTASQRPPPVPAVPTAGATRPAQAAALTRMTRPLLALGWARRRRLRSTPRLRVPTRRLPRPPSALRRRVPGRVVGVPMPRLPRPWVRRRRLRAADTTVHRPRLRMVARRRRRRHRAGFSMPMMIEGAGEDKLVPGVNGSWRLARKGWRHQRMISFRVKSVWDILS